LKFRDLFKDKEEIRGTLSDRGVPVSTLEKPPTNGDPDAYADWVVNRIKNGTG
jgi:hypothetical protein